MVTIRDDSFGDGLTLGGKLRRLRVDFDSSSEADSHFIASVLLRQLNPAQRKQIREVCEVMIAAKYDCILASSIAALLTVYIEQGRVKHADVIAALSERNGA